MQVINIDKAMEFMSSEFNEEIVSSKKYTFGSRIVLSCSTARGSFIIAFLSKVNKTHYYIIDNFILTNKGFSDYMEDAISNGQILELFNY